jgi:hypothetical protein
MCTTTIPFFADHQPPYFCHFKRVELIRTSAPEDIRHNATQALPLRYPSPPIIMYYSLWWTCPVDIGRRSNAFLSAHKLPAMSDEFPMIVNVTLLFPASNESISLYPLFRYLLFPITSFYASPHYSPCTLFFSSYSHTSSNHPSTF